MCKWRSALAREWRNHDNTGHPQECLLAPASQFLAPEGEGGVELYAGKSPISRLTVLSVFAGELKIVSKNANRDWQHAFELPGDYVCEAYCLRVGAGATEYSRIRMAPMK